MNERNFASSIAFVTRVEVWDGSVEEVLVKVLLSKYSSEVLVQAVLHGHSTVYVSTCIRR